LKAIKRAEGGEGVLPVARKLGISRKLLHDWIKAWKAHGPEGLNRKRGPKPGPRRLKPVGADDKKRSARAPAGDRTGHTDASIGHASARRARSTFRCGSDISPRKCPWRWVGGCTNMAQHWRQADRYQDKPAQQ